MSNILAFDTSNYTTSACVFSTEHGILWENRILLPVREGECGVRQNDAVFLHTKNLQTLFDAVPKFTIDFVCASKCPSEKHNSYMPCFNVGMAFAKTISSLLSVPYYECSHQKNHICAAIYSTNNLNLLKEHFIAYHVSGGTTDVCLCSPSNNGAFDVLKIGGTADISCGQLIDRTGVMLGLAFPAGKSIESLSDSNLTGKVKIKNTDGYFNFSGFENKTSDMFKSGNSKEQISNFALDVVCSFLISSITYFRQKYNNIPIILSGGVMSNKIISNLVSNQFNNIYFSNPKYSVDNALGTAVLCAFEMGLFNE